MGTSNMSNELKKVGLGSQSTPLIFEILSKHTIIVQVSIMDLEFV